MHKTFPLLQLISTILTEKMDGLSLFSLTASTREDMLANKVCYVSGGIVVELSTKSI